MDLEVVKEHAELRATELFREQTHKGNKLLSADRLGIN